MRVCRGIKKKKKKKQRERRRRRSRIYSTILREKVGTNTRRIIIFIGTSIYIYIKYVIILKRKKKTKLVDYY